MMILTMVMLPVVVPVPCASAAVDAVEVAVVVELKRPFVEAAEGLKKVLEAAACDPDVFTLEQYAPKPIEILKEKMTRASYRYIVGIGPQATRFVLNVFDRPEFITVYAMVLNPDSFIRSSRRFCGVSLNIPIPVQVHGIASALPQVKRIGLLYDPGYNGRFFIQAQKIAEKMDLRMISLGVSSSKQIPGVMEKRMPEVDALWMIPDPTVISESVIQYIIQQALWSRVPVIGYNRFFYESGAALNFIFNYKALGEQTGKLVLDLLKGAHCRKQDPTFGVYVNRKVAEKLGLAIGEGVMQKGDAVP